MVSRSRFLSGSLNKKITARGKSKPGMLAEAFSKLGLAEKSALLRKTEKKSNSPKIVILEHGLAFFNVPNAKQENIRLMQNNRRIETHETNAHTLVLGNERRFFHTGKIRAPVKTVCFTKECVTFTAFRHDASGKITGIGVLHIPGHKTGAFKEKLTELIGLVSRSPGTGPVILKGIGADISESQGLKKHTLKILREIQGQTRAKVKIEGFVFGKESGSMKARRRTEVNIQTGEIKSYVIEETPDKKYKETGIQRI